jgi:23S rRNA pseudouridine1911/1915/1917 synthase
MGKNMYIVTHENKRERLDTFLSAKSNLTRSHVQKLLSMKLVLVNSHTEKAGYRLREGDTIALTIPDEPKEQLIPEDIPLDVLWEDEYIIIVNKPPRMVIYPAAGNRSGTLMNALISKCNKLSSVGAPLRPGVVHRLDKDTSGALVIAKDDMAYYSLVKQFKKRETEKHYLALLHGKLKANQGEIRSLIGRSLSDRKKMSTRTRRGKEAITHYEVMERFQCATLAKVRIITGRTHQIRVHFASLGNPVLGDRTYGKKTELKAGQKTIRFSRQMLHACSLKLRHPATGEMSEFTAPMPEDMECSIEELSKSSSDPDSKLPGNL